MWDVHNERLLGGITDQRNNRAAALQESKDLRRQCRWISDNVAGDVTRARQGLDLAQIIGLQSLAVGDLGQYFAITLRDAARAHKVIDPPC